MTSRVKNIFTILWILLASAHCQLKIAEYFLLSLEAFLSERFGRLINHHSSLARFKGEPQGSPSGKYREVITVY